MNDYSFGNFVCMLREKKGLTQADIAQELGVTPAAVSKWENGSSKPRVEILFRLANILEVRPEELMAGRYIVEEALSEEAANQINARYEYLRRIELYDTARAKIRRIIAWVIDWNLIGSVVLVICSIFSVMLKDKIAAGDTLVILIFIPLMLLYPITFVLRDFVFGGRSLGKRMLGLTVLDIRTGEKSTVKQRLFRNILLPAYQADIIVMLISGRSLGDRMVKTVVVCKKDLQAGNEVVTPSDKREWIQKINAYPNSVPSPKARKKKKRIITFSIIGGAVLFVCVFVFLLLISLNAAKDTEEYKIAYEYVIESQEFEKLGSNEDKLKFMQYSKQTVYGNDGQYKSTVCIGFYYGLFERFEVICHDNGDGWSVCTDCTEFD